MCSQTYMSPRIAAAVKKTFQLIGRIRREELEDHTITGFRASRSLESRDRLLSRNGRDVDVENGTLSSDCFRCPVRIANYYRHSESEVSIAYGSPDDLFLLSRHADRA